MEMQGIMDTFREKYPDLELKPIPSTMEGTVEARKGSRLPERLLGATGAGVVNKTYGAFLTSYLLNSFVEPKKNTFDSIAGFYRTKLSRGKTEVYYLPPSCILNKVPSGKQEGPLKEGWEETFTEEGLSLGVWRKKVTRLVPTGAGLFIHGKMGLGKSMGAVLIMDVGRWFGLSGCYVTLEQYLDEYNEEKGLGEDEQGLKSIARHADILLVDDVNENQLKAQGRTLHALAIDRAARKKPTIITSNIDTLSFASKFFRGYLEKNYLIECHVAGANLRETAFKEVKARMPTAPPMPVANKPLIKTSNAGYRDRQVATSKTSEYDEDLENQKDNKKGQNFSRE